MRCRKVRSFLSAYCRDELSGSRRLAVAEHLSTCSDCRREESEYRSMLEAAGRVPAFSVSKDFSAKLFNRIAEERFAETRTKAYLPKRAPLIRWATAMPALAAACALVLVGILMVPQGHQAPTQFAANSSGLDDSYRTVQPVNNPNLTNSLEKDWSLSTQIARAERLNRISRSVAPQVEFYGFDPALSGTNVAARSGQVAPYMPDFVRIRPVIRIYQPPHGTTPREVTQTY